ncbi:MAG: hypothetical protein KatS3mg010_2185 [Acidimicrobiia bacterium]|nr:MAG: hypothetical protein KatS3mg010_2185 [Acidimicrobiia bacterium]
MDGSAPLETFRPEIVGSLEHPMVVVTASERRERPADAATP